MLGKQKTVKFRSNILIQIINGFCPNEALKIINDKLRYLTKWGIIWVVFLDNLFLQRLHQKT